MRGIRRGVAWALSGVAALSLATAGPAAAAPQCAAPSLPGAVVTATAWDMGAMMGSGMMGSGMMGHGMMGSPMMGGMRLTVDPVTVRADTVSLLVRNMGMREHEVVILPLVPGQSIGQRNINSENKIDEAGSLGEAATTCGSGDGEGIAPGAVGWTTVSLPPGRYELVCNIAGHYASGMYAELDVSA